MGVGKSVRDFFFIPKGPVPPKDGKKVETPPAAAPEPEKEAVHTPAPTPQGMVSREEFNALAARMVQLERKVRIMEVRFAAPSKIEGDLPPLPPL